MDLNTTVTVSVARIIRVIDDAYSHRKDPDRLCANPELLAGLHIFPIIYFDRIQATPACSLAVSEP
jgi:hypothetical protein